ncbi:hypothetical protein KIN20_036988 [Parelaphostrongylus tenuis]|uniref:Uncharacterized protein n=1 Tax=Parelaphostrongylus tenuis TaxID=148309 RepID=A0AAD5RE41_PARTN|nr:hypothetical protein KIN20_036988 [Parelaphostrongylus tenuis]
MILAGDSQWLRRVLVAWSPEFISSLQIYSGYVYVVYRRFSSISNLRMVPVLDGDSKKPISFAGQELFVVFHRNGQVKESYESQSESKSSP